MEISLSVAIWKYALLGLSILISIIDVALVSFGVEALGCAGSIVGAYSVTALGTLACLAAFTAMFASLRESLKISVAYLATTALSVVLQTIFMIYFAAKKSDLMLYAASRVDNLWENGTSKYPAAMDNLQAHYYCCGRDNPQDHLKDDDDELPSSCCLNNDCTESDYIFSKGCHDVIVNFFDDQSDNMILTLVGLVLLEALGIAAAYYFTKSIEKAAQKDTLPVENL